MKTKKHWHGDYIVKICVDFMDTFELEIKQFIVDILRLEDVTASEIDSNAPLFVEGLGLDSIDALELAMAIRKKYQVSISADDEDNAKIFSSVRNLAQFISQNRHMLPTP